MKKHVAIILCGCGFKDGSEIHESVSTLLAIDNAGAEYQCYAPSGPQARVIDHISGAVEAGEERLMIKEAARIARGKIKNINELSAASADALILPGGFGSAFNLCNFAEKGAECTVHPEVARVIRDFHSAKKPLGFICIAPVIAAKVLGSHNVELTIGADKSTAVALSAMGAACREISN